MGFVFKFGSNGTNFDVSTPFLMGRGGGGARPCVESYAGVGSLTRDTVVLPVASRLALPFASFSWAE